MSRALQHVNIRETIVHTGQHYDRALSAQFFDELGIPPPRIDLLVGSLPHGQQIGLMMQRLDMFFDRTDEFDAILVYGDTNSTVAGALVAANRSVPVAHIEAGLRSHNRSIPEEISRVVTDHLSTWLFCPTSSAVNNLAAEGIRHGVYCVGDVMLDALNTFKDIAAKECPLSSLTVHPSGCYVLATVHRPANNRNHARLGRIVDALGRLGRPVIFPAHPATARALESLSVPESVEVTDPVGYFQMCTLIQNARCVITDSGGVQKEAYWHRVPCSTLRPETEWPETLRRGWNACVDDDPDRILAAVRRSRPDSQEPFGTCDQGTASDTIASVLGGLE